MARKLSLRQQNRLTAMRVVQAASVAMFETDGFDATTVEAVAEATGVSASTIYRHFGTKEALVLWDEQDASVDAELAERLGAQSPLQAFKEAVVVALTNREDMDLFLRRLRLIYSEASIWRAAALQDQVDRAELTAAFAATGGPRRATIADEVAAASCLAALDVALDRWQQSNAQTSLADVIDEAINAVASLS
ncbi:MAG: TetR/AcrR family transcriptional regulator [Actinomycetia bacterium]|nr:TetR/AcrR family transcriptional regulator [Actinomycetes bacterium]MCP5031007.1 TetR/AcrR family transcriptional regulator [Actinomycetes bacterium]